MWKDFLWPLLVLQDPEEQTLSVALSRLSNTSQVPLNVMMAGLVIASVPMVVVFLIFQRSIIGGLSAAHEGLTRWPAGTAPTGRTGVPARPPIEQPEHHHDEQKAGARVHSRHPVRGGGAR